MDTHKPAGQVIVFYNLSVVAMNGSTDIRPNRRIYEDNGEH